MLYKTDKKVEGAKKALGKCCLRFEKNFSMGKGSSGFGCRFCAVRCSGRRNRWFVAVCWRDHPGFAAMNTLGIVIES